ncbi:MAG: 30S ribosomal protein S12 methylthiotransferase RimO, partial [Clostridia bacterium]|nr:30S ribosomal protein S12 methylthiotransferase RimO [Clostridia bacterium]
LKIAEGCDNRCSYCVIPSLRGRYRSRPAQELVEEAESLARRGVRELVLVAQDTTRYGEDLYGRPALAGLLRSLAKVEGIEWLRVLYGYPDRITDELIDVIASEPKIVKYIDIPIQHVNARILKAMNRRGTKEELVTLIAKLRARIPGLTLRTTVITGFPGETEEEFAELVQFVKDMQFERLGAFAYSCEEGTAASLMEDQIPDDVKKHRQELVMEEQSEISAQKNAESVGKKIRVLAEGYDRWAECCFGRSASDAPEIDGKVFFSSKDKVRPGSFVDVIVEDVMDYDLMGTVV